MAILVTGGAGFIGSNFIINWINEFNEKIINIDKLTYSGNLSNLKSIEDNKNYVFVHGDICNASVINKILNKYKPRAIINFAAETHVDRSINQPDEFINVNILGTFNLLKICLNYWQDLNSNLKANFRFLQISTDEVYGSLKKDEHPFQESSKYKPNSPYSASKASGDHLVRAYSKTYGLPVLITNCSNNYGPFQFPEKLIPLMIKNALNHKYLPIYGDGLQIRDWLYVSDHCRAITKVLNEGKIGEVYNIGGKNEKTNLEIVNSICSILDKKVPKTSSYKDLITFVEDRHGHDFRYAIDATKIEQELGWVANENFNSGIEKTIDWYLENLNE